MKYTEYTFYWRDGKRDVYPGNTPDEALNNAGFGAGALRALDFWARGDNKEYQWNDTTREWDRLTPIV